MLAIEKKELVASVLVVIFDLCFLIVSIQDFSSSGQGLFRMLKTVGMVMMISQLAFMPGMFFLPIRQIHKAAVPTLLLSRATVLLITNLGLLLFVCGFVGEYAFIYLPLAF